MAMALPSSSFIQHRSPLKPYPRICTLFNGPHITCNSTRSSLSVSCMVSRGDFAPDFRLRNQDGIFVNLSDFKGKPVVLYFYPADNTPGCTREACAFRDSYEKFKEAGAEVIGVSGDSVKTHKAFVSKHELPFMLISDSRDSIRKQWKIPGEFFGALPGRQTYVIDRRGIVQMIFNDQYNPELHVDAALNALSTMGTGGLGEAQGFGAARRRKT